MKPTTKSSLITISFICVNTFVSLSPKLNPTFNGESSLIGSAFTQARVRCDGGMEMDTCFGLTPLITLFHCTEKKSWH